MIEMSALELLKAQVRALLKFKIPVVDMRDVIEARADEVLRAEKKKGQREGR